MINVISEWIKNNNYTALGLKEFLDGYGDRRYKATWCGCFTSGRSGTIKYLGIKYNFFCIAPWKQCPKGKIYISKGVCN